MQLSDKALGFDNVIIFTCIAFRLPAINWFPKIKQLVQGQIQIISFYLEPPVTFFFQF